MKEEATLWDKAAENPQTEKVRGKFLTNLFLIPINKGLAYLKEKRDQNKKEKEEGNKLTKQPTKFLKVDLWNEGVDFQRNILKHYDNDQNELFGIDIAFRTCALAKKHEKNINVSNGSITDIAFKSGSFDILLDMSTSDHVPPEDMQNVLNEYSRVLKKDGVLILIFDWWGLVWYVYMYYLEEIRGHGDYFFKDTKIKSRYIHPIKLMKQATKKSGLKIKDEYCIDYTGCMWNRVTRPFWEWLPQKGYDMIHALEYSKISKYLRPFAKQYVIIAQKG
jgi:SAM-dependent methyltransferase